jgi:hypothetical protein
MKRDCQKSDKRQLHEAEHIKPDIQLVKKLRAFYETETPIKVFTTAFDWTYPEPDESSPHPHILRMQDPF